MLLSSLLHIVGGDILRYTLGLVGMHFFVIIFLLLEILQKKLKVSGGVGEKGTIYRVIGVNIVKVA